MATATATLGEILAGRAESTPDRLAFTFSSDGEAEAERITYLELHRRSQALAARLLDTMAPGSRALLLCDAGLDFVTAMYACLQAGVIAVTAAPPHPKRLHRTMPRLHAIAGDADVSAVLATTDIRDAAEAVFREVPADAGLPWIAVDEELEDAEPGVVAGSELAFMQYTSGSTTAPRGVMVTHANVADNVEVIGRGMHITAEATRTFSWLPPSHDMGLITGILQPVYFGYPAALMSPLTVIKRPVRWLEGIMRFGATISGAPNFAYDLAVRRTTEAQREGLDLSCWRTAFNGAEPVLARTVEQFCATFAPCGFRRTSFYPCYGLAESTLMVSGPLDVRDPTLLELDAAALEAGRVRPPAPGGRSVTLVGCGEPGAGYDVAIVDGESRRRAAADEVGEIWLAGASVARGYWRHPEQTREVFEAVIEGEDGERAYLRTGDLGFLHRGELFVLGRGRDLIILQGRNHHAHDIEVIAESAHERLRPHCSAAFALERESGERAAAIVMEIDAAPDEDLAPVVEAVRRQVVDHLEIQLERVALVPPGAVPKTTSGKIQRQLSRRMLADGRFELRADWRMRRG